MMYDKILEVAINQVPSLVVLVYLVTSFQKRDKERDYYLSQLHAEHLAARGESREAIKENTESNREVVRAIERFAADIRHNNE